jgi:hypothetical protein
MRRRPRRLISALSLAALMLGFLAATPAAAAAVVIIDGSVSTGPSADCVIVTGRDGKAYLLEGTGWQGITSNDVVRLEGRYVPVSRCGLQAGFEVNDVATVWSDEGRREMTYSRDRDGRFRDWARRHRDAAVRKWDEMRREHRDHERQEEHREAPPPR